jgi:CheY-like chemotaxis protein
MPELSPNEAVSKESAPAEADVPASSGRLLIAEDAQCVRRSVGMILGNMQLDVDMAENGLIACQMAEKSVAEGKPYDLILMDMHMPKMNGRDATRHLREYGWRGPIVAVSVSGEPEDQSDFLKAGCDDCVVKPVTQKKLQAVLTRYLKLEVVDACESESFIAMTDITSNGWEDIGVSTCSSVEIPPPSAAMPPS